MDEPKKCLSPLCDRLTYTTYCCRGCWSAAKGIIVIRLHPDYCDREIAPRTGEKK